MKNIDYDSILSGFQRKRLENEILADSICCPLSFQ